MKTVAHVLRFLQHERESLKAEFARRDRRLSQAMEDLRKIAKETPPPKIEKPQTPTPGGLLTVALEGAVAAQTGNFTVADLRNYLQQHYGNKFAADLKRKDLSTRFQTFRQAKRRNIIVVKQGAGGPDGPSIFRVGKAPVAPRRPASKPKAATKKQARKK